ncbi:MAG: hypothetical protein R2818_03665 [Flavobacteriales bacterium]
MLSRSWATVLDPLTVRRMNITYAKDYTAWRDIQAVLQGLPQLGQ